MVLYADVLFAINFSMDFFALFITSRIFHRKIFRIRIIIASLIGAIYGILDVTIKLNIVINLVLSVIVVTVMIKICFNDKKIRQLVIMSALYMFVSATLGGIMSMLYTFFNRVMSELISDYTYETTYASARKVIIFGLTLLVAIILVRIFSEKRGKKSVMSKVIIKEKVYELSCLCDSGNLLKDPFSGRSVMLVSKTSKIGQEIESIEDIYKRYIPYKDVNGEGLLKGILPKQIIINDTVVDTVIATVENRDFGGYDALISSELV